MNYNDLYLNSQKEPCSVQISEPIPKIQKQILKNEDGIVTALVSKDEAQACEIDELVEKKFEGSLPAFIAAFTKRQDLSNDELDEVQQMIDRIRKGEAT